MPTPVLYADVGPSMFDNVPERERRTTLEVFYATTRSFAGPLDDRTYGNGERDTVRLGQANVRIGPQGMTWDELVTESVAADRSRMIELHLPSCVEFGQLQTSIGNDSTPAQEPATLSSGEQAFVNAINQKLEGSTHKHIGVYVHGIRVDFYNACVVSGELHHYLARNGVMTAFAWPCRQTALMYWPDAMRAQRAACDLAAYLNFLAKHTNAERIDILAYSAGAAMS
jgi:esterase/lipase superfamily enzyme